MRSIAPIIVLLGMVAVLGTACEKDDICLEGTQGTPRMQFDFFDFENPDQVKGVGNLTIKAVGIDSIVPASYGNLIPLRTDQPFTIFEFTLNANSEQASSSLVQFNYDRWDEYINRACGYRAHFILNEKSVAQKNPETSWIKGFKILQDTISNEEIVHLALYH